MRVGAVLSQTGAAAVYGATQLNGVQLAADQLNDAGGVSYELDVQDDGSDAAQGLTAFEHLINRRDVSVLIGPTLSATALSADRVAQDAGIPVLGVSNTAPGITDIGEYVFRNSLTEAQVIPHTIRAAVERLGLARVAVLYGDDDAFTEGGYEVFVDALREEGVETVSTQTFAKGDADFSAQLAEIRKAGADALVVSALAEEAKLILEQARTFGVDLPVIGGNGFNSPALIDQAGDASEGVIVGAAWNAAAATPGNPEFIAAYEEAYGSAPDQFAAQAYVGLNLLDRAIRSTCDAEPRAIRDGLAGVSGVETVLGEFSFTESRDADHPAVVQVIENGQFTILQ